MIKVCLTTIAVFLCAASVSAQPRPGAFTTLTTSDTSVTSLCVGANAIPPATCLGGAQMGPAVVNQAVTLPSFTPGVTTNKLYNVGGNLFFNGLALATGGSVGPGTAGFLPVFTGANSIGNSIASQAGVVLTIAGTLTTTGFGTHNLGSSGAGLQTLDIGNAAAGGANGAALTVGANGGNIQLKMLSTTFTPSGASQPNWAVLQANGATGLAIDVPTLQFYTSGALRGSITTAGLWSWTTFGAHSFAGAGTSFQTLSVANSTAGAAAGAGLLVNSDTVSAQLLTQSSTFTTAGIQVQAGSTLFGNGPGGFSIATTHASGALRFYTQGIQRWGINAAGDHTFGTVPHIADSSGTPVITSGFGGGAAAVVGTDYAFRITNGNGAANSGGVITFGHTFSQAPVCTANTTGLALGPIAIAVGSSSQVTLSYVAGTYNNEILYVLCRGY